MPEDNHSLFGGKREEKKHKRDRKWFWLKAQEDSANRKKAIFGLNSSHPLCLL